MRSSNSEVVLGKVKVTNKALRHQLGTYDRRALNWDPQAFVVESAKLDGRVIESSTQRNSLLTFAANPKRAMTYIVSGNPDDKDARYFAAYLAQLHIDALGLQAHVRWEAMLGAFDNPAMRDEPSLLIITNLTPRSSNLKYEKTRDLLERHATIPKVLVVAGEDPISFAATRLYAPVHAIAYFGATISKTFNEVI